MNTDDCGVLTIIAAILVVLPYPFYSWAYKSPRSFSRFCSQQHMIKISVIEKFIAILLHFPACYNSGSNLPGLILGTPLVFLGQYLSELVYAMLGDRGVYYGLEFRTIKPCKINGFPFTIRDPQYKGSYFTVLGWFLAFNTTKETALLFAAWTLAYFGEMIVENTVSGYFIESTEGK